RVLLHQVQDDLPRVVRDHGLVEHLERDVTADRDDRLGEVPDDELRAGVVPRAVIHEGRTPAVDPAGGHVGAVPGGVGHVGPEDGDAWGGADPGNPPAGPGAACHAVDGVARLRHEVTEVGDRLAEVGCGDRGPAAEVGKAVLDHVARLHGRGVEV